MILYHTEISSVSFFHHEYRFCSLCLSLCTIEHNIRYQKKIFSEILNNFLTKKKIHLQIKWKWTPCLGSGKQDVMKALIFIAVLPYKSFSKNKSILSHEPDTQDCLSWQGPKKYNTTFLSMLYFLTNLCVILLN